MRGRPDSPIDGTMPPDLIRNVRLDDPQFEVKLVVGLLDARNQVNGAGQYTSPEYVGDKTRCWGTPASRYYQLCAECGGSIHWLNAPTGGWWAHDAHPADDHDALPPLGMEHPDEP